MKPKRSNNQRSASAHRDASSTTSPKSGSSQHSKRSENQLLRSLVLSSSGSKTLAHYTCSGCKKPIKRDKYLLKTCNNYWHEDCLRCDRCHGRLGELGSTLYTKSSMNLCRKDYLELFGETGVCSVCEKLIRATEMVMRAKQNVYHLECFACQMCNERFCVGDRFYLCENKVICQYDFEEHILPIQKSMIAQSEASNYYSRQQQTSMSLTKEQQFDLMSLHQEVEHQNNNNQCQQGDSIYNQSILDESCGGGQEQSLSHHPHHQSHHNLITIQHGDNNTTRFIQLDDFRMVKRLEDESGSSLKAATKKDDDASNKQSSNKNKEGSSLFCNHNNSSNESLINNNIGDDDNTSAAIKGTKNDKASAS